MVIQRSLFSLGIRLATCRWCGKLDSSADIDQIAMAVVIGREVSDGRSVMDFSFAGELGWDLESY